ncbi:hypothetical protein ONZ45_g14167 [Pleurotus djamor]|nr:hypothetical protein ONZ45_g14167 [Pleurotus djamor]
MSSTTTPKLFQPTKVGRLDLQHRIILAPLTRHRATKDFVPIVPMVAEYYAQRASTPGTLLITEATYVAPEAGGFEHAPGIWSEEQIAAWRQVTDAVHARGSYIYMQLWALGRAALHEVLSSQNLPYVSASDVPLSYQNNPPPRTLTIPEIHQFIRLFAKAAHNAVHLAGFDGVELHGAHGYLVDQFLQDTSNNRTDEYGGSIENRARFALEVIEAITKEIGQDRTGMRISPWSQWQEMRMKDPRPNFAYFVGQLKERFPDLAYLHVTEPRINDGLGVKEIEVVDEENDFLRKAWGDKPFISAGGHTRERALKAAEDGLLIGVGRHFLANPDLPLRWKLDLPLNPYNRPTFYLHGDDTGLGYTDYPFAQLANNPPKEEASTDTRLGANAHTL